MNTIKVNGELYKQIVTNGAINLHNNYKEIDSLNVFPVPDGDTGTNMSMTIQAGVQTIKDSKETSIYEMAKELSHGMLMGARGNSGVILSQFFRGLYKGLAGYTEVGVKELGLAFNQGVTQAYHAVQKPVEGTILTVCKDATNFAVGKITKKTTFDEFFDNFLEEAYRSLERTPDLLPVLKDAGVVDSGAAGFIKVIEGMSLALKGEMLVEINTTSSPKVKVLNRGNFNASTELTFGYCTEFILQLQHSKVDVATFDEKIIIDYLVTIGNSIVCFKDEDIVKAHVHTKTPGEVFNFAQQFGEFITIKVENMQISHTESQDIIDATQQQCNCPECVQMRASQEKKKFAIVAVANGAGLTQTFKSMGVDYIVSGGQTMNPSSEDFVKGFDSLNAENIFVFPNNSNIIMAAEQAAKYYDKANVIVIKSKSLAQGYSALTMFDVSSGEIDEIVEEVNEVIKNVTTCLVTYSIRDASIDGVEIKKDDYIGIVDGKMVTSTSTKVETVKDMLSKIDLSLKEIATIITGAGTTTEELNEIIEFINKNYPDIEVDTINGGQDVYSFILSIE